MPMMRAAIGLMIQSVDASLMVILKNSIPTHLLGCFEHRSQWKEIDFSRYFRLNVHSYSHYVEHRCFLDLSYFLIWKNLEE